MNKNSFGDFTNQITPDRDLELDFFEATVNFTPVGVLCIFGNQDFMGRVFTCSAILRSKCL